MIRSIVAFDSKRGIATEKGIPWDLPTDRKYSREKIQHTPLIMGYGTYKELSRPATDKENYVASRGRIELKEGFIPVEDAIKFLENFPKDEDIWVWGGAGIFASTIHLVDELYITRIDGDFQCTKFFPEYEHMFRQVDQSEPLIENDILYRFEVWRKM